MRGRIAAWLLTAFTATLSAQAGGFKIVVIEGEDAVNIIQQKTAVRPVVEVRDRNNLPVPGVLVTFSIEGGKAATFGGASTLTVATNAAGQAAVTGLTPSVAGAFQIQVSALAQGQVVTATIAQTNVLTAAQAAAAGAASSGGSAGGSAGGGAGGTSGAAGGGAAGGGGLSATTIGIVGAAVGGGALVATQVTKEDEPAGPSSFSGPFTGQIVSTIVGVETCVITRAVTATMQITLDSQSSSAVNGKGEISGSDTVVSQTCGGPTTTGGSFRLSFTITGSPASLGFREQHTESRPADFDNTQTVTATHNYVFQGTLANGVITGTLVYEEKSETTGGRGGIVRESATGTFPITLR
jgi:hypothetical protein